METKIAWTTTTGKAVTVTVTYLAKEHIISTVGEVAGVTTGYQIKADRRTINGIEIGGTIGKLAVPMAKYIEIMAAVDAIKASPEYTTKVERIAGAEAAEARYQTHVAKIAEIE